MQYFGKEKDITKISMDLNSRAQRGTVGDKTVREKKMFPALVVILQYCNKTYLDDYITFSSISCFLACCRLGFFFCRETICHPCFWFSARTPGSCETQSDRKNYDRYIVCLGLQENVSLKKLPCWACVLYTSVRHSWAQLTQKIASVNR